jgi:hypothetical protein
MIDRAGGSDTFRHAMGPWASWSGWRARISASESSLGTWMTSPAVMLHVVVATVTSARIHVRRPAESRPPRPGFARRIRRRRGAGRARLAKPSEIPDEDE